MDTSDQPRTDVWSRLLALARAVDSRSYYQLLGVTMEASGEELRRQFTRRTALIEAFPRSAEGGQGQRVVLAVLRSRLREAHEVLTDSLLRQRYDEGLGRGELRLSEIRSRPTDDAERVRNDPRAPFSAMVRVSCAKWADFLTLHANNISRGGLFVRTATPLERGAAVTLRIVLPQQYTLELDAEVVRTVHAPTPGMGLAFRPMDDFRRSIIERLVLEARTLASAVEAPSPIEDEAETSRYERQEASRSGLEDLFSRPVAVDNPGEIQRLGHDELCIEARALLSQQRYGEARLRFAEAIRHNSRDLSLRAGYHLACAYEAKLEGRLDDAHEHFERVLIFDKNCRAAIRELRT